MRYNARKKISIYTLSESFGDYGEVIITKSLYYTGTQLVVPMTASLVKKEYGVSTNSPKKIIFNKPLPRDTILIAIGEDYYSVVDRTDFDKFNILLIDINERGAEYISGE